MALKEYLWRGHTYQIADEDLPRYPGAIPVGGFTAEERAARQTGRKVATPKAASAPLDKSTAPSGNKRRKAKDKGASE